MLVECNIPKPQLLENPIERVACEHAICLDKPNAIRLLIYVGYLERTIQQYYDQCAKDWDNE